MKIEDWKQKLKGCKRTEKLTAQIHVMVRGNKEKTRQEIYKEIDGCKHCGSNKTERRVDVEYYKPQTLTVFQASLLYLMYVENKRPQDYAGFHECVAGKEFIENIKSIEGE